MNKKYFGTDGIRGRVGEGPITAEFMLRLGYAAGRVFAKSGNTRILIGKDTRISGYMFESALEAGLMAAGAEVRLLGVMPTPAIAYLTRTFHAQAGIVISASHNPFHDNGIKFFSGEGKKLPDDVELAIEAYIEKPLATVDSDKLGKAYRVDDAKGRYIEFCKSTIPRNYSLNGLKVVLDCANGATYAVAPAVFNELGADVITLHNSPNGQNINLDCGSTHPESLRKAVLESQADIGIAFDGDGDRVIMCDAKGEEVDGDHLTFIIAAGRQAEGRLIGGVVGTLMSNFGMEQALLALDIEFIRANVGDRYVMKELTDRQWQLGGESSGHIVCLDTTTTGDGIISALQVLAVMIGSGKTLYDLKSGMHKLPQKMINVRLSKKTDPSSHPDVVAAMELAMRRLDGKGRVLLRPSGTEPVIRVMVEGEDIDLVSTLTQEIADAVEKSVS